MDNGESSYRRFLAGDESGFAELVGLYRENLTFFIHGIVGNITVAEDLMEDTFCDLIVHKKGFKGKSSFKTYLFTIARNNAIKYLKKRSRISDLSIEDHEKELSDETDILYSVVKEENKRQLYTAMSKINPDYRAVLHLLYFENMSYEEAAIILRKSGKQINNLAYRAKQSLKNELEKGGFVYEVNG